MTMNKMIAQKIRNDGAVMVDLNLTCEGGTGLAYGYAIAIRNHIAHRYSVFYDDTTGECNVEYNKCLGA